MKKPLDLIVSIARYFKFMVHGSWFMVLDEFHPQPPPAGDIYLAQPAPAGDCILSTFNALRFLVVDYSTPNPRQRGTKSIWPTAIGQWLMALTLMLTLSAAAQYPTIPLNHDIVNQYQSERQSTPGLHSSFLPLIDTADYRIKPQAQSNRSWLYRKAFQEHLIDQNTEDFHLSIDPVFDVRTGLSGQDERPFTNTRGAQIQVRIGTNVWVESGFYLGWDLFPDYVSNRIRGGIRSMPGNVIGKGNENGSYDYLWGRGTVMWRLNKFFTLRGGADKHFIGDGYRSTMWSDNAYNNPFVEIRTNVGPVQYVNLWTVQRDINYTPPSQNSYFRKYVSSHYLSWNITPKLEFSLIETIVWAGDSSGVGRMEPEMLNPVIFLRAAEYSVNSSGGNAIMGTNIRYTLNDHFTFYGQFTIDEWKSDEIRAGRGWWANKWAWQLGMKGFNLGLEGLHAQLEYNSIRPYMYSHHDSFTSFTHYNYSNAHAAGANLREGIAILRYNKDRWRFKAQFNYLVQGRDTLDSNWGGNPLLSYNDREQDYGNEIGQGVNTKVFMANLEAAWVVNPATDLQVEAGYTYRGSNSDIGEETFHYFYFGLRTVFANYYYDY